MSDFPTPLPTPLFLNTYMRWGGGFISRATTAVGIGASAAWPAANTAIYVPLQLPFPYAVKRVFWINGSIVTGTYDLGIYGRRGNLIVNTGAIAQSGASSLQYVNVDIFLAPGAYYLALLNNGTTNRGFGGTGVTAIGGRAAGLKQQAVGAATLPAAATFATWTGTLLPIFGLTRTGSGF